ncbi:MAG: metallophosphoesterase [Chloroflexota bacterium]|nr:metallophosphoesterase [Chloroflexota bacterium]
MKILSISDKVVSFIYSPQVKELFGDVDLVLACGDLPYYYQEYIISLLNVPMYFVHGNHDLEVECSSGIPRSYPFGGLNLHHRVVRAQGLLLAGVEGCINYSGRTLYQYTQREMWWHVLSLVPGLVFNKALYGRYLDIFVTHAPPKGIHEGKDWTHQGIHAFRWLLNTFQPRYYFHGHVHRYRPDTIAETQIGRTMVLNTYPYRVTEFDHSPIQKT